MRHVILKSEPGFHNKLNFPCQHGFRCYSHNRARLQKKQNSTPYTFPTPAMTKLMNLPDNKATRKHTQEVFRNAGEYKT